MYSYEMVEELDDITKFLANEESDVDLKNLSVQGKEFFVGKTLKSINDNNRIDTTFIYLAKDFIADLLKSKQTRLEKLAIENLILDEYILKNKSVEDFEFDYTKPDKAKELSNEIYEVQKSLEQDIYSFIDVIFKFCKKYNFSKNEVKDFLKTETYFENKNEIKKIKTNIIEWYNNVYGDLCFDYKELMEKKNLKEIINYLMEKTDEDFFTLNEILIRNIYEDSYINYDDGRNSFIDLSYGYFYYCLYLDFGYDYREL